MDYHDDLEGLPSDALESDYDFDQPVNEDEDYSSWPAESSPAPVDEEEEQEEEEYDQEEEGSDDEIADEADEEEEEEEYSELEIEVEDDFADHDQQRDHDNFDEHDDLEIEEEEELEVESVADGDDGLGLHDWEGGVYWPSQEDEGGDFFEDDENDRALDDLLDDDSLFVDQRPANILPPIEELISSVRRNHARALNLLHSEILRQDRELGREPAGPSRENHRQNHRHHPYNMPREDPRERRGMADRRHDPIRFEDFDELIEVEMQAPPRAPQRRNRTPPRAQPLVIDLTADSDAEEVAAIPPRARGSNASQVPGRRPRREPTPGNRTPSLSRGGPFANNANVIDLTLDDSPAAPPPLPQQLPRRNNPDINHHHRHHHHRHHSHRRPVPPHAEPIDVEAQEGIGARITGLWRGINILHRLAMGARPQDVDVQIIGGRLNHMDNPLGANIPNLNYRGNGHNGAREPPKPDHVPPPPAREGFTRDTGSADDVVICPGCEQELKYDPDAAEDNAMRPAKKPRNRKDQEEHHFWALKDCGHVYCKNCYENRTARRTKNLPPSVFRRSDDQRKLLCKVDDCMTEVNRKENWVGLFL